MDWKCYNNWLLRPIKPIKTRPRKVNWYVVIEFVKQNHHKTLQEIGEAFKISTSAIFYILKMSNFIIL